MIKSGGYPGGVNLPWIRLMFSHWTRKNSGLDITSINRLKNICRVSRDHTTCFIIIEISMIFVVIFMACFSALYGKHNEGEQTLICKISFTSSLNIVNNSIYNLFVWLSICNFFASINFHNCRERFAGFFRSLFLPDCFDSKNPSTS